MDENMRHDSSCVCETVARALERVMQLARAKGRPAPTSVLALSDNTVRESKNQYFLSYILNLTASGKMKLAGLLNLRKSHSHDQIDQLWGILARRIAATDQLKSPSSVIETLQRELQRPGLRAWVGQDTEVHVQKLDAVRAWRGHFTAAQQVSLSGGLLEDASGNHCFLTLMRRGLWLKTSFRT